MKSVTAWAPANISLLFKVIPHDDPAKMGSLGCGFTVNEGVTVGVSQTNQAAILFNGKPINFPTIKSIAGKLTRADLVIDIQSKLPLGSGFGISGASALATVYAVNKLLSLNTSPLELARLAHTAEVENKTGLGDVINQYFGGFFVKFVTSSQFKAVRIPISDIPVYCRSFGKLETPSILKDPARLIRVDRAGEVSLAQIKQLLASNPKPHLTDILTIAKQFAKESSLLTSPSVNNLIGEIESRGGHATMIMLGEGVVSDIPVRGATKVTIASTPAKIMGSGSG